MHSLNCHPDGRYFSHLLLLLDRVYIKIIIWIIQSIKNSSHFKYQIWNTYILIHINS